MTRRRACGPTSMLGSEWDMVYGSNVVVHVFLKEGGATLAATQAKPTMSIQVSERFRRKAPKTTPDAV